MHYKTLNVVANWRKANMKKYFNKKELKIIFVEKGEICN